MENISGATPSIDWESRDLESALRRFEVHNNFMFSGPLKDKSEEERCSYLMLWVGEKGRNIYSTWTIQAGKEKELATYFNGFKEYVKPRSNTVYNRFLFQTRTQKADGSFDQFYTELKLLVKDCTYDKPDEMVRDRLVAGTISTKLRDKLLSVGSELTLTKTLDRARTHEVTKQQNKVMSGEEKINYVRPKQNVNKGSSIGGTSGPATPKLEHCERCGKSHRKNDCKAMGQQCRKCGRYNHFAAMCKTKPPKPPTGKKYRQKQFKSKYSPKVHVVDYETDNSSENELFVGMVYESVNSISQDWAINSQVNNKTIQMHIDSGAKCNVISEETLKEINIKTFLRKSDVTLKSFSGHTIKPKGTVTLPCTIKDTKHNINFQVIGKIAPTILGDETSEKIGLIKKLFTMNPKPNETDIVESYKDLFTGIGCLEGEYSIKIDRSVPPTVHPPRKVTLAIKDKLKAELDKMEQIGVIVKQDQPTEWVNSMVTPTKPNGKIRVCIDPRDLNQAIQREHYPMKTIEDITPKMQNAKLFSKLDATSGYWSTKLDEQSSRLCTFNSPFGRYSFKRMPFGIKSAAEVYQKRMTEIIQDIEGCEVIVDDIIIWGEDKAEHDRRLKQVLDRVRAKNLKLNSDKCEFRKTSISYCGHVLSEKG